MLPAMLLALLASAAVAQQPIAPLVCTGPQGIASPLVVWPAPGLGKGNFRAFAFFTSDGGEDFSLGSISIGDGADGAFFFPATPPAYASASTVSVFILPQSQCAPLTASPGGVDPPASAAPAPVPPALAAAAAQSATVARAPAPACAARAFNGGVAADLGAHSAALRLILAAIPAPQDFIPTPSPAPPSVASSGAAPRALLPSALLLAAALLVGAMGAA
jgi:hypothetical protein